MVADSNREKSKKYSVLVPQTALDIPPRFTSEKITVQVRITMRGIFHEQKTQIRFYFTLMRVHHHQFVYFTYQINPGSSYTTAFR